MGCLQSLDWTGLMKFTSSVYHSTPLVKFSDCRWPSQCFQQHTSCFHWRSVLWSCILYVIHAINAGTMSYFLNWSRCVRCIGIAQKCLHLGGWRICPHRVSFTVSSNGLKEHTTKGSCSFVPRPLPSSRVPAILWTSGVLPSECLGCCLVNIRSVA